MLAQSGFDCVGSRIELGQAILHCNDLPLHSIGQRLPADSIVWLTFSNTAYLHFAQNWFLSVKDIGRHEQVVIAALDPQSLETWIGLGLPVLNYSHFGDASDFRGIGSDQARFRRMGAMKVRRETPLLLACVTWREYARVTDSLCTCA